MELTEKPELGHHPLKCPSSNAEYWRAELRGEQGPRGRDAAETVDLDTYKFCKLCDPSVPEDVEPRPKKLQTKEQANEIPIESAIEEKTAELVQLKNIEVNQKFQEEIMVENPWESFLNKLLLKSSDKSTIHDKKETLRQINKSLTLSLNTLLKNPQELASQLAGRLLDSKNSGVQEFLDAFEEKVKHIWFRPRGACLLGPESPIIYSWPVFDEVPPCRLIVSENEKFVAAVSKNKRWIWEIETGKVLTPAESEQLFLGVNWNRWSKNLPDKQFKEAGRESYSMETPKSTIRVSCSIESETHKFDTKFTNSVNLIIKRDISEISKNSYYANYASMGYIAPAISKADNKIICGGLEGIISIWDLASKTLESTMSIGNRTIVAIAGFSNLKRCVVLTLDGQLLIVEFSDIPDKSNKYLAPTKNLFISKENSIAVSTHLDGAISVWCTDLDRSFLRKPSTSGNFRNFFVTPDLSFAIITGHAGRDDYDGWLIIGIELTTGVQVFSLESLTAHHEFGTLNLELFDNQKYLRIDPITRLKKSYSDVIKAASWVSLSSGETIKGQLLTPNRKLIGWADRDMYKVITNEMKKNPGKKYVNLELPKKIHLRSESTRTILLTPDLSLAIVKGLAEDRYDGWLLIGFNLTTEEKVFSLETFNHNEMFGTLSLEIHDDQHYLRVDPFEAEHKIDVGRSSYADEVIWISLTSGKEFNGEPPTPNGKQIEWATLEMYTESTGESGSYQGHVNKDTNLELPKEISLKNDRRAIQFARSNVVLAQFTIDEDIKFIGNSPFDNSIIFVTRAGLFTLDLIENS